MSRGKKTEKTTAKGRPMRYANGFGNVSLLSSPEKRRKPYIVRIPNGWKEEKNESTGKTKYIYKYKVLAYVETWEEGNNILVEYNNSKKNKIEDIINYPVRIEKRVASLTFCAIYEKAVLRKISNASEDTKASYSYGYNLCKSLHKLSITDIKTINLQTIIDDLKEKGKSTSTLRNVRKVMNLVLDYAVQNDLIDKQYASYLDLGKSTAKKIKIPFNKDEIDTLFTNDTFPYVDVILILLFTGLRINEFLKIENCDIHIGESYLIAGSKTEAGKNRIIPLNDKIKKYIVKMHDLNKKYLFSPKGYNLPLNKSTYRCSMFNPVMEKFSMKHIPHECRHTCATLLDDAGANKVSIQKILGHKGNDITEQVYTHKNIDMLLKAINMI